uniref:Peptidase S1 domain-containing protein n=1 Tax=Anopheles atroparvus TaxID=41427 RepID=A0AAG5D3Y0_ANOAO
MHLNIAFISGICCHFFGPMLAQKRHFGGDDVTVDKFPFVVAISFVSELVGNGAIIAPRWILSSASAFQVTPHSEYIAHAGGDVYKDGERYPSEAVYEHPEWNGYVANIALMKLKWKLKFGAKVKPIKLFQQDLDRVDDVFMISYGKNALGTKHLQGAPYFLTSDAACLASLNTDYAKAILQEGHGYCVNDIGGNGARGQWHDDTGAPMVKDDRLVALWILRDDEVITHHNNVSLATRVFFFGGWIESTMKF